MKNEDLECLAEKLGLEIKGDTVFGFFKPITVDEFWLIVSEHLSECVQKGMFENVAFECMLQNKCELAELCSKIEKHIKERNVHMKVDLECMMNSCNVTFNSIALTLGLEIVDDKVYPGKPVSLDNFKKAIGEYVAEEIESGNNSALIFESLAVNDDDRDCLKEMIFDAPCEVDSDD